MIYSLVLSFTLICFIFCNVLSSCVCFLFFFNDTATTEIYTLSLHDALPISTGRRCGPRNGSSTGREPRIFALSSLRPSRDRKSTRLNSSHLGISYAVFCLKKKKSNITFIYRVMNKIESHLRSVLHEKNVEAA